MLSSPCLSSASCLYSGSGFFCVFLRWRKRLFISGYHRGDGPSTEVPAIGATFLTYRTATYENGDIEFNLTLVEKTSPYTFASLLRHYGKAKALSNGRRLHAQLRKCQHDRKTFLGNCLVEMYGNCGSLEDAQAAFDRISFPNVYSWNILLKAYGQNGGLADAKNVFDRMPCRDVVSWTAIIGTFAQNKHGEEALNLFHQMQLIGAKPNKITYVCALEACASLAALEEGEEIHAAVVESGYEKDVFVGTALVTMYGKCRNVDKAASVFATMPHRNVVSWTAMISAFAQNGLGEEALDLFCKMHLEGHKANNVTFVSALDACARLACSHKGKEIHAAAIDNGYGEDAVLGNALFGMYVKCGSVGDAKSVFCRMPYRDVVNWTAMIASLAQNGSCKEAIDYFHQMQSKGISPDNITFSCALDACASLGALEEGQEIHVAIVDSGDDHDLMVKNALINMYGKCGSLLEAKSMFDRMSDRDVVSWTAMLGVSSQNGQDSEALYLFQCMQIENVQPNIITFVCVLDACATLALLEDGQEIHLILVNSEVEQDVVVTTALINMYGKCGSLQDARNIFTALPKHDIILWTAMIAAFAQNGDGKEALNLFQQMQLEGIKPNGITFICVLAACSCTGLVHDGMCYFASIDRDHGMKHCFDHYVSMIDLLGRAGRLDEAEEMVIQTPFESVAIAWLCLLNACRIHCDVERAVRAANCCLELDPSSGVVYVTLSNIYALAGLWDNVACVRETFKQMGTQKSHNYTFGEVNKMMDVCTGGVLYPQIERIQRTEMAWALRFVHEG